MRGGIAGMARMGFRSAFGLVAALAAACGGGGEGGPKPRLVVHTALVAVTASRGPTPASTFFGISVTNPPPAQTLYAAVEHTTLAVAGTGFLSQAPDAASIFIDFKATNTFGPGTYSDTVTVHVCRDPLCEREIAGSPAQVPVALTVIRSSPEPEPEADIAPLPILNQHVLGHDVIDAEYSNALDAIVMVSVAPAPALHVYHTATGTEQSIALAAAPKSVSVGPDGLTAAVGHTNTITIVDLANIDDPVVDPRTLLNLSTQVGDVVLAGNGYVHALAGFTSKIRSVHIATNVETAGTGSINGSRIAKLHPTGTKVYGTSTTGSFDIERYDVTAGVAAVEYDSSNTPSYPMGGNLWIGESGTLIFTAGSHVFRAADVRADDMAYAGQLKLASTRARSLSHSTEHAEVALLEDAVTCSGLTPDDPSNTDCYTRLGLYEHTYLNLVERYSLAPVNATGGLYGQRGKFIFHTTDGSTRYLISRRLDWPDAEAYMVGEVAVAGSAPPGPDPLAPPAPVVDASTEAGIPAADLVDAEAVPHDVIDAEFSTALNAIVMASSFPTNAVYIHDVATRTERSIALAARPTSVSVAPDGMHAAVGHDGQVTVLDLAAAGAQAPISLVTSIDVRDVVMAGNGYVYAFPRSEVAAPIQSLHVATGVETSSSSPARAGVMARLHPAGDKMYGANEGVGYKVERYSFAGGTAQIAYEAPNTGITVCGNVWFSAAGTRIFTPCGYTFVSSDDPALDMVYEATLELSNSAYRAVSISEVAGGPTLLLEKTVHACGPFGSPDQCFSHVNLYDSASLARTARYSLSSFTVGQRSYPQRGLFVFHDGAGTNRYVISKLDGMPNRYAEFYISRMQ